MLPTVGSFSDPFIYNAALTIVRTLPIGCVIIVCLLVFSFPRYSRDYEPDMSYTRRLKKLYPDSLGALFLISSLALAVYGLQWVGTFNAWGGNESITIALGFLGSFLSFFLLQLWLDDKGTVPFEVACTKDVVVGAICFLGLQIVLVSVSDIYI